MEINSAERVRLCRATDQTGWCLMFLAERSDFLKEYHFKAMSLSLLCHRLWLTYFLAVRAANRDKVSCSTNSCSAFADICLGGHISLKIYSKLCAVKRFEKFVYDKITKKCRAVSDYDGFRNTNKSKKASTLKCFVPFCELAEIHKFINIKTNNKHLFTES